MGRSIFRAALIALLWLAPPAMGAALAQTGAPVQADASAAGAAQFIRDSLLHDSQGYPAQLRWRDGQENLADVTLTGSDVILTVASGKKFTFPLAGLKLTYDEPLMGSKTLSIGNGDFAILFSIYHSREVINRVSADFALLGQAAQTPQIAQAAAPAPAPGDANVAEAFKFLRDHLLHDADGDLMRLQWPGDFDDIADVAMTHNDITLTVASGRKFPYPLRGLKIIYHHDFLGGTTLEFDGTGDSILFHDYYTRDVIQKIQDDFAILSKAAETPEVAPPAPARVASAPGPGGASARRLAIQVVEKCQNKPSAASFLLDEDEDECEAETLDALRGRIVSTLAGKGGFAGVGDGPGDVTLTVTLTKNVLDTGVGGLFGDFGATYKMAADYALADGNGSVLASGTVNADADGDDGEDQRFQQFADKLATTFLAQMPAAKP